MIAIYQKGLLDVTKASLSHLFAAAEAGSRQVADIVNISSQAGLGASHVAMLFMAVVGDNVRVADDMGMYGQTFLLTLAARGLGGVPQTLLGLFANAVREVLGVPVDLKLLYGILFGHPNDRAEGNRERLGGPT